LSEGVPDDNSAAMHDFARRANVSQPGILDLNPKSAISMRLPIEGRIMIVANAGRDAMDVRALPDEQHSSGRQSRVVLAPRRWCQVGGSNPA
jgi:hypothetical protein